MRDHLGAPQGPVVRVTPEVARTSGPEPVEVSVVWDGRSRLLLTMTEAEARDLAVQLWLSTRQEVTGG